MMKFGFLTVATVVCCSFLTSARAVEISQERWEQVMRDVEELKQAKMAAAPMTSKVDIALDSKYGPNAPVTTKTGKLTIGFLTQIWYYNIQRDSRGFFNDPNGSGVTDNNLGNNINSFRIRRTEMKFTMDFNENLTGVIMMDPAREVGGYPSFPSNQGLFKKTPTADGGGVGGATFAGAFGGGLTSPPRLLQDAFINYHGIIPYHDFQIGQFKPWVGEEGIRSSAELDFAERSILGQMADNRDMGASLHGSWWGKDCNDRDGRLQYWAGVFNGSGTFYNPGNQQNRSDNNQSKDFNARILVRPLWDECWGKIEVGVSYIGGRHGPESHDQSLYPAVTLATPIAGQTYASKENIFMSYKFGKWFAKGLWLRGEWGWVRDRQEGTVIAFGNGNLGGGLTQTALEPFNSQGGYGAIGYRFADSDLECMPKFLKGFEVLGRYEQFQNIETTNVTNQNRTSVFNTHVTTAGLNYYFSGNTKIQLNYNAVDLPTEKSNGARHFHSTRNDNFVVNFQLAF